VLDICVAFVAGATANSSQLLDLKQKTALAPNSLGANNLGAKSLDVRSKPVRV
jgi:hypothetical protein